jgi:hypothetical protein
MAFKINGLEATQLLYRFKTKGSVTIASSLHRFKMKGVEATQSLRHSRNNNNIVKLIQTTFYPRYFSFHGGISLFTGSN